MGEGWGNTVKVLLGQSRYRRWQHPTGLKLTTENGPYIRNVFVYIRNIRYPPPPSSGRNTDSKTEIADYSAVKNFPDNDIDQFRMNPIYGPLGATDS